jgi:predicted N-formylglutamate amidohydrolase
VSIDIFATRSRPGRNSLASVELLVTCEHGGNEVPAEYAPLFAGAEAVLASHRGFDAGALDVARAIAAATGARLIYATTSRLIVDLNRSARHPRLLSEWSRKLDAAGRAALLARHYTPYRLEVERCVAEAAERGVRLVHICAHSFTPVLDGAERKADVGLLFDPRRDLEARAVEQWQQRLRRAAPAWRVRKNYPYRGVADGLTTHLRRKFDDSGYAGIELEINQRLAQRADWAASVATLAASCAPFIETRKAS